MSTNPAPPTSSSPIRHCRSASSHHQLSGWLSATSATACWRRPAASASPPTPSLTTTACRTRSTTIAGQAPVEELPEETLVYLLGSRYCETDLLSNTAWQLFGGTTPGYPRVQAICDYVHNHIAFNYQNARSTRTACGGLQRTHRRLPRFRPSRHHLLPLHEYSRPLLHRLFERRRERRPRTPSAISPLGSKPGLAAAGTCSTRATTSPASAAFLWPAAAMLPMSPSPRHSAPTISNRSKSGSTKFPSASRP